MISIITPVYNAEKFIRQTLACVLNQDHQDWEWLLVDDCSTDSSYQILEEAHDRDARIIPVRLDKNSGAAVARNKGLELARGRFIAFIDADDYWTPEKLSHQLKFMMDNHYAFTYTNFALVDEQGQLLKERVKLPRSLDYYGLLKNTAIACSTVMLDRDQVGDFRMPLVRKGQDTATWLRILRQTPVKAYLLDEVLNHYRQVAGSVSSNKWAALKRTWHTYRHLEGLPFFKCLYYYSHYVLQAILRRL